MKNKILVILLVIVPILSGCIANENDDGVAWDNSHKVLKKTYVDNGVVGDFKVLLIEFGDGHDYLVAVQGHGISMIHATGCRKCPKSLTR